MEADDLTVLRVKDTTVRFYMLSQPRPFLFTRSHAVTDLGKQTAIFLCARGADVSCHSGILGSMHALMSPSDFGI